MLSPSPSPTGAFLGMAWVKQWPKPPQPPGTTSHSVTASFCPVSPGSSLQPEAESRRQSHRCHPFRADARLHRDRESAARGKENKTGTGAAATTSLLGGGPSPSRATNPSPLPKVVRVPPTPPGNEVVNAPMMESGHACSASH